MKKAKIILSAVAVFALVGGAFAFKAARFGQGNVFYTTTVGGVSTCTLHPIYRTNTTAGAFTTTAPTTLYSSRNASNVCALPILPGATIYVAPAAAE